MRLYYCKFPENYLKEVYETGWPSTDVTLQRTAPYEMLNPQDRVAFFDVLVALVRKLSAGNVMTGYLYKDFPENPVFKGSVNHSSLCLN